MKKSLRLLQLAVIGLVLLAAAWTAIPAFAQTSNPTPSPAAPSPTPTPNDPYAPSGFRLIASAAGVQLFKKDYSNGSPDFVQVVDLGLGAKVELLHGNLTESRPSKGSYGGPDPRMTSPAIQTYWKQVSSENPLAFCVINGSFFYMPEYPTRLAFPLKVENQMITEGWGINTYPDQKMILELWSGSANIEKLSKESLYGSTAPAILGGLAEDANKRIKYAVGRTFTGVDDRDGDGQYETILFLTTRTSLQSSAARVLRDFGAERVMMLDGGGSTQLLCGSGHHIRSDRPIPQALAIIAADPPQVAAQLVRPPQWQVFVEGERIAFEMEIRNTGVLSWTAQETRFQVDPSPLGMAEWMPVEREVQPGATVVVSDTLPIIQAPGVYQISLGWGITRGDKSFQGSPISVPMVVLPRFLANERSALAAQIQQWHGQPPEAIEAQVETWLAGHKRPEALPDEAPLVSNSRPPLYTIRVQDVFWIPLLMLPIVILVGIMIKRKSYY